MGVGSVHFLLSPVVTHKKELWGLDFKQKAAVLCKLPSGHFFNLAVEIQHNFNTYITDLHQLFVCFAMAVTQVDENQILVDLHS